MPIYWSFLVISYIVLLLYYSKTKARTAFCYADIYSTPTWIVIVPISIIAFFASLRDEVQDTYYYIGEFKNMPTNREGMLQYIKETTRPGFHWIMFSFKLYISENYYWWLAFIACSSLFFLFRFYARYSCNFSLTFFLFVGSTSFTWLFNGARQFLTACLLIGFIDLYLSKDKKNQYIYILLALIMTTIHSSVWFVLPLIYMCARGKLLDKWMFFIVLITIFATIFIGDTLDIASQIMDKEYDISGATGSSVVRLLVASVPSFLVLYKIKVVRRDASRLIVFAINMSLVGVCFFLASTFSSGILIGRMPIFFTLYNYILIPWLIKNYYNNIVMLWVLVICYTIFFYYQMCVAWHHLNYTSYILGIEYSQY